MNEDRTTAWVKATASNSNGSCVEMRRHTGAVEIRDTKQNGQGPTLTVDPTVFRAWINAAKTNHLDGLTRQAGN